MCKYKHSADDTVDGQEEKSINFAA